MLYSSLCGQGTTGIVIVKPELEKHVHPTIINIDVNINSLPHCSPCLSKLSVIIKRYLGP